MPKYCNWSVEAEVFVDVDFVKREHFIRALQRIREDMTATVIEQELFGLETLKVRGICGRNKRFPDDGQYVNTTFGFYADVLATMDADDSELKWRLRYALLGVLTNVNGGNLELFNRDEFERRFDLRWKNGVRWKWIILLVIGFWLWMATLD